MSSKTENLNISDVLKTHFDLKYNAEKVTLTQVAEQTDDLEIGQILDGPIVCASGAGADGVLLQRVEAADLAAGTVDVLVLVRGPAIIDSDRVTIASNQKTAALAALKALGILSVTEPTKYEEGTDN